MKTAPKTAAPRGMWYNRFLDKQSEIFALVNALKPVAREIAEKEHQALDDSWNPDYHIELTLSVRECREIQKLVKKHAPLELTEAQKQLQRRHGTPEEFSEACNRAADGLEITTAECNAAIEKYNREWMEAGQNLAR